MHSKIDCFCRGDGLILNQANRKMFFFLILKYEFVVFVLQIIMAKPAGGPKPPSGKKDWDDDQND